MEEVADAANTSACLQVAMMDHTGRNAKRARVPCPSVAWRAVAMGTRTLKMDLREWILEIMFLVLQRNMESLTPVTACPSVV